MIVYKECQAPSKVALRKTRASNTMEKKIKTQFY